MTVLANQQKQKNVVSGKNMPYVSKIFQTYAWYTYWYEISLSYIWDISQILRYAWDMSKICLWYAGHMLLLEGKLTKIVSECFRNKYHCSILACYLRKWLLNTLIEEWHLPSQADPFSLRLEPPHHPSCCPASSSPLRRENSRGDNWY